MYLNDTSHLTGRHLSSLAEALLGKCTVGCGRLTAHLLEDRFALAQRDAPGSAGILAEDEGNVPFPTLPRFPRKSAEDAEMFAEQMFQ